MIFFRRFLLACAALAAVQACAHDPFGITAIVRHRSETLEPEMRLARSTTLPLLSFNLGVELGPPAIAAIAVPLIRRLYSSPAAANRGVPAVSILVAAAGTVWLWQRTILD